MGQEDEMTRRLKDFEGFQITEALGRNGKAKADWKFMHCLPRHEYEVDDEVGGIDLTCLRTTTPNSFSLDNGE